MVIKFQTLEEINLKSTQIYTYLWIRFITTVNMNEILKLRGTNTFNSRSKIYWTFRQFMLVAKICMLQVQTVDCLIRQDS